MSLGQKKYKVTKKGKATEHRWNTSPGRKIVSKRYRDKTKNQSKAHYELRKALLHGEIEKEFCAVCNSDAEAHHPDYDKPLEVIWLCHKHHMQMHYFKKGSENYEI